MSRGACRLGGWIVGFTVLGWAAAVSAQQEANLFGGASTCNLCHEKPTTDAEKRGVLNRVCLRESAIWNSADRHSVAYASLLGERGKRMGELLKKDVTATETGCIQCHATSNQPNSCVINQAASCETEGVGCESCHGPSGNWIQAHFTDPLWRDKKMADVRKSKGWVEIRSPIVRAEVCNSCHVGSAEDHRLITHDMYAAGHPPLSGFEIESFSDKMPRHWRYSYERPQVAGAAQSTEYQRTRNVLVGSVVGVRMAVELAVADASAPAPQEPGATARWPELARMDCYACHHELIEPGWRQYRKAVAAVPGRPQLTVGCVPLVAVAAEVGGNTTAEKVDKVLARLQTPFERDVFGDPQGIAEQGAAVTAWCKELEDRLDKRDYKGDSGQRIARQALHAIAEQCGREYYDYDTARQLFGAWMVIYGELVANQAIQPSAADTARLDAVLQRINGDDTFSLERNRMQPPCEAPTDQKLASAEAANEREARLDKTFVSRADYMPATFSQEMRQLDALTRE